jgi:AcrR family transcriptional regulator
MTLGPSAFTDPGNAGAEERARITTALVEIAGARGFRQTRLRDVLDAAGVSAEDFHRDFLDLEDCFVKVWQDLTAEHADLMATAYVRNPEWRQRMRAMAEATLGFLQADRNRARFLVLEVIDAGETARALRDRAIAGQAALIDEGRCLLAEPEVVPASVAHHVAGAINEMLIRAVRSGELFEATRAVDELMFLAVRPYLGHEVALEELRHDRTGGARDG